MWHFVGIELISDRIPDQTTILSIHHLLEKQDLVQMKQDGMTDAQANVHDITRTATLLRLPWGQVNGGAFQIRQDGRLLE